MTVLKAYSHLSIHRALLEASCFTELALLSRQAYACPYYVPLTGILGSDWGVIVNPESPRFGRVVFEHDDCGCFGPCPRGNQRANQWLDRIATKREYATAARQEEQTDAYG